MSSDVTQQPTPEPKPQAPLSPALSPPGAPLQPPAPRPAAPNKTMKRVVFWSLLLGLPLLFFFLMIAGLSSLLGGFGGSSGSISEKNYSKRMWTSGRNKIAIIHLEGSILSADGFIKKQIERVMDDETVKGVVFRISSPGGLVTASDHIYQQLLEMRDTCYGRSSGDKLPMVVSMGGMAASGGYYVAMAVGDTPNSIYAETTTWTGSIGVIIPNYDVSKAFEKIGVKEDAIGSHPLKGMGSIGRELSPEARKILKGLVDNSAAKFKRIVKKGRPKMSEQQIEELATGQVFHLEDALAKGLVDKEGYLEDAIRGVIEMAGLDEGKVRVVEYERQPTLIDLLIARAEAPRTEVEILLELAKPQACYLAPGHSLLGASGERR
jgi:protease-4